MTKSLVPIVVAAATLTAAPAFAQHRGGDRDRDRDRGRRVEVVRPYVYAARRPVYAAPRYYRPYYSFRPRISIGFGIWAGYPVAYPVYSPYYRYGYAPPYGYGSPAPPYADPYPSQAYPAQPYPSQGYPAQSYPPDRYPSSPYPSQGYPEYDEQGGSAIQVQPRGGREYGNAGGVSFEISPSDAAVLVDGTYVGTVDQFGPQSDPLRLSPGRHRIEIRAQGLQPMTFDADIAAGQVIPYRGTLQR